MRDLAPVYPTTMTFDLWYLIIDNDKQLFPSQIAFVSVSDSISIAELKVKISDEMRIDVSPHLLKVWKLRKPQSHLDTTQFIANVELVNKPTEDKYSVHLLEPMDEIRHNGPWPKNNLHVLIQLPYTLDDVPNKRKREEEADTPNKQQKFDEERNRDVERARMAPAPSSAAAIPAFAIEQEKRPVLNGRPYENYGLPVGLFHPVFNTFHAEMRTEPYYCNRESSRLVMELFRAFASIYKTEDERIAAIDHCLAKLLGKGFQIIVAEGAKSDGAVPLACGKSYGYPLILEVTNEVGSARVDPSVQACLSYRKYHIAPSQPEAVLRKHSYCPSFLLAIAGPWLCVMGAVYVDKVVAQPLTDYLWLGGDIFDEGRVRSASRLFASLKLAISSLTEYYTVLGRRITMPDPEPAVDVDGFPYINEYGSQKTKFTYQRLLDSNHPNKLVFLAYIDDNRDKKVVVKFASRYNTTAHRILAEVGEAPQLFFPTPDDNPVAMYGGRHLIVMDFVSMESSSESFSKVQHNKIKKSIQRLHQQNIVFGDLRSPNILVDGDRTMLIDFD
ncbi:hypothetical protein H0H93_000590, partial [Arthromyces matolae]